MCHFWTFFFQTAVLLLYNLHSAEKIFYPAAPHLFSHRLAKFYHPPLPLEQKGTLGKTLTWEGSRPLMAMSLQVKIAHVSVWPIFTKYSGKTKTREHASSEHTVFVPYLVGDGEGEEVEPVGVPLGDDLAEGVVVLPPAHLLRHRRRDRWRAWPAHGPARMRVGRPPAVGAARHWGRRDHLLQVGLRLRLRLPGRRRVHLRRRQVHLLRGRCAADRGRHPEPRGVRTGWRARSAHHDNVEIRTETVQE